MKPHVPPFAEFQNARNLGIFSATRRTCAGDRATVGKQELIVQAFDRSKMFVLDGRSLAISEPFHNDELTLEQVGSEEFGGDDGAAAFTPAALALFLGVVGEDREGDCNRGASLPLRTFFARTIGRGNLDVSICVATLIAFASS